MTRSKGQLAGGGAYCSGFPHSLLVQKLTTVLFLTEDSSAYFQFQTAIVDCLYRG